MKFLKKNKENSPVAFETHDWWETQPSAHTLLRLLFRMILVVGLVVIGLFVFLQVHETVPSQTGEILTENAPVELLAPFDARLAKVLVQEGSQVKKGDTLLVLQNDAVESAFRQSVQEIVISEQGVAALELLVGNLAAQMEQQKQGKNIISASGRSENASAESDLRGLREQLASEESKFRIAADQYSKSQKLFAEGVVSALELQGKFAARLDQEKTVANFRQLLRQREIAQKNLPNVQADRGNQQNLALLGRENELLNTQKTLSQERLRLETLRTKWRNDSLEASKQFVTAPDGGLVSQFFNARQKVNLVEKGQSLLVLVPPDEAKFYARLAVDQRQVQVQPGAAVRLKVDAFHYLKFGIVPGEVTFVGRDTATYFYVLAKLRPAENPNISLKNGYRVQGDIVVRRVRLWRYFWDKIFQV